MNGVSPLEVEVLTVLNGVKPNPNSLTCPSLFGPKTCKKILFDLVPEEAESWVTAFDLLILN